MADDLDDSLWKATVGNGIPYTELVRDGSPTFSIENDGSTLTRTILVKWDDLDDAKDGFLGYPEVRGAGGDQQWISRHVPDAALIFANRSGLPYLFATKLSGSGYGMPADAAGGIHDPLTDFPIYRYAKLEVGYETLTYDVLGDDEMIHQGLVDGNDNPDEATLARYVTPEPNPGAEYLTLPTGGFKFVGPLTGDGPAPVPGGPGKIVPNYDLSLTWHLVPRAAVGSVLLNPTLQNPAIDLCLGNVNSQPFPSNPVATVLSLQYAIVESGGDNYTVGDLLAVNGSGSSNTISAVVQVTAISGGGAAGPVKCVVPVIRGLYKPDALPALPVAAAGGTGTGVQLQCAFGAGFPVGSLLMTGATIKPVRSTSGDRLYDLIYRFKFLQQGIQFLYYQGTSDQAYKNAGYFEVTTNGSTNLGSFNNFPADGPVNIYPWADFNQLFRVPS